MSCPFSVPRPPVTTDNDAPVDLFQPHRQRRNRQHDLTEDGTTPTDSQMSMSPSTPQTAKALPLTHHQKRGAGDQLSDNPLVTLSYKEFSTIPGLDVEDSLADSDNLADSLLTGGSSSAAAPDDELLIKVVEHIVEDPSHARVTVAYLLGESLKRSSNGFLLADTKTQKFLFANMSAQKILGRLDLVGKPITTVMPKSLRKEHAGRVAAYLDRYKNEFQRSGQAPTSRIIDAVQPTKQRMVKHVNHREVEFDAEIYLHSNKLPWEAAESPPRIITLEFKEVTEARRNHKDVTILKQALTRVSDGVVVANMDGRIEWMNAAAEELSGRSLPSVVANHSSVSIFVPAEMYDRHEGFIRNFKHTRRDNLRDAESINEAKAVVLSRKDTMRTALGTEEIVLRVEVLYNKLVGFMKSTKEFIPREEFETARLRLLLPNSVVKMINSDPLRDITSHFWESPHMSIVFTSVPDFSSWALNQQPRDIHTRMQPMFESFENIAKRFGGDLVHRVEDSVIFVFGYSGKPHHHARLALSATLEFQRWAIDNRLGVRIGLHSGAMGAGVYGNAAGRPGFDIWGPNVNKTKRMEENGELHCVHFTQETLVSLGDHYRQEVQKYVKVKMLDPKRVKGLGEDVLKTLLLECGDAKEVSIPENLQRLLNFQRAEYQKWVEKEARTEQRLRELQGGNQ